MDLLEAIYRRKSTRIYSMEGLPEDKLKSIEASFPDAVLFQDSENEFQIIQKEEIEGFISGYIGSYGKIEAPYYIIASCRDDEMALVDLGYSVEKIVLEITCMGLATCWIGSNFDKDALQEKFVTGKSLIPQALIAFGKPGKGPDALRKEASEAKRKDISELILRENEVNEEWAKIIDAARMAPSAMNSQPWRFQVKEGKLHLYIKSDEGIINRLGKALGNLGEMNWIDAGIALYHIKIAANRYLEDYEFQKMENKQKDDLSYIISVVKRN